MLMHCTEKWQVTKKSKLKINNLKSSNLVPVHQFCFCILLLIGVNSELAGLVDS